MKITKIPGRLFNGMLGLLADDRMLGTLAHRITSKPPAQALKFLFKLDAALIEYTLETFAAEMKEAGLLIKHLEVRWGEIWSELLPDKQF